jgi:hypothetical protein
MMNHIAIVTIGLLSGMFAIGQEAPTTQDGKQNSGGTGQNNAGAPNVREDAKQGTDFLRVAIGIGQTYQPFNNVTFDTPAANTQFLVAKSDQLVQTSGLVGLSLNLWEPRKERYLLKGVDFLLAIQFGSSANSSQPISGFTFGVGASLFRRWFQPFVGFSLGPGTKLAEGFKQAAGEYISELQSKSTLSPDEGNIFARYKRILADQNDRYYDGFPIGRLSNFGSRAIVDDYNYSFQFGLVFPIELFKRLQKESKDH